MDKQRQSKDVEATPFDFSEKVKPDAGPMTLAIENFKPASIQILDSQIHAVMDQDRPLSGKSKSLLTPEDPRSKFLEEFSKGVFKLKRSTSSLLLASEIAQPKTPSIPNLKQSKNPNLIQSLRWGQQCLDNEQRNCLLIGPWAQDQPPTTIIPSIDPKNKTLPVGFSKGHPATPSGFQERLKLKIKKGLPLIQSVSPVNMDSFFIPGPSRPESLPPKTQKLMSKKSPRVFGNRSYSTKPERLIE